MVGRPEVVWNGTAEEAGELAEAIGHNCECAFEGGNRAARRLATCPPHHAMVTDQRFMNGLLWMRHMRAMLEEKEWTT